MKIPEIDIKNGEIHVKVDGYYVLKISQVSDNECINLYLDALNGDMVSSEVAGAEIIVDRTR